MEKGVKTVDSWLESLRATAAVARHAISREDWDDLEDCLDILESDIKVMRRQYARPSATKS